MDKILGKIYLDETGKAPFVVFEGKAAATKEYICWLERIVAEERGVSALQTTNTTKVETVTPERCHAYAEQVCNHNCVKCKYWY
jgi:hypothetical protein